MEHLDIINKKIIDIYEESLIIDIDIDKVYKYLKKDNKFILDSELSYIEYINNCQNFIYADDLQDYISSISISSLENSNNNISLEYRKLDNKLGIYVNYLNNISLYVDNGKKIIVVLVSPSINKNNLNEVNDKTDFEDKYNKMIDTFSLGMLKIHNAINMDNNLRTKDEYINSILVGLTNDYPELNKSFNENAVDLYNSGKSNIMIIDDDKIICTLLSKIFTPKYDVIVAHNGEEAIDLLKKSKERGTDISCIFLDLVMPIIDGFGVLEYLNDNNYFNKMPVIIISGNYDRETRAKAYSYQIADMLEKPFNAEIIKYRIENLISLYKSSSVLNAMMLEQHDDLRKIINSTMMSYEFDYSKLIKKMKKYVKVLAIKMQTLYPEYNLNDEKIDKIVSASSYYALANYILPKTLLNKKIIQTDEEKMIVKRTIINSAMIIKNVIAFRNSNIDYNYATDIIRCYTENYDGSGYPEGLKGENIPLSAQMVSLVIEYINLTCQSNNQMIDYNKINESIEAKANIRFNPKVVEAYKLLKDEFIKISKEQN